MSQQGEEAPPVIEERSPELFGVAAALLGGRLAHCQYDPDRGLRLTIVDMTEHDVIAIQEAATRLGVDGWVRVEPAEPAHLIAWEGVRHHLIRLSEVSPRLLSSYPAPEPGYRRPPVEIHLTALPESVAAAEDLHDQYGDFVSLHVGALRYPLDPEVSWPRRGTVADGDPVDPAELNVSLNGPLSVPSGHTVTHDLDLLNRSNQPITVLTNGHLTARVTDPATGATVGGYVGAQIAPMVSYTADPQQTVRIPLVVGTASLTPALGYTVPAGRWQLTAPLGLADGRHLISPPLPFTVTD